MIKRICALAVVAAALALTGCTLGREAPGSSAIGAVPAKSSSSVSPDKGCGGANGVTVTPCPIRLDRHTKRGVVVTVGGHRVVNSYLGRINACIGSKLCYYAERYGSSETEWLITPGRDCGNADVEFMGENADGKVIGYAFLKVSNRYCP